MSRVFHAVDPFGSEIRHHVAQATWTMAYADGMTPCPVREYGRDARSQLRDPLRLPFLKDILKAAVLQSTDPRDVVVWTNSDIGFAKGAAHTIGEHVRHHRAATMRRVESNGERHIGRDLFAFTVAWLAEHWEEMPDYVIGVPIFDIGIAALVRKFHRTTATTMANLGADFVPADMPPGVALHESHDPEWRHRGYNSRPALLHNRRLFHTWAMRHAPELRFTKGGSLL